MKIWSIFCLFGIISNHVYASSNPWDSIFHAKAYKGETLNITSSDVNNFGGKNYTAPLFETSMQNPLGLPSFAQITRNMMLDKKDDASTLVVYTLARTGFGVRRDLVGDPLTVPRQRSEQKEALISTLKRVFAIKKTSLPNPTSIKNQLQKLPDEIQKLASFILESQLQAYDWRQIAFKQTSISQRKIDSILRQSSNYESGLGDGLDPNLRKFAELVDMKSLGAGMVDLTVAVEETKERLTKIKNKKSFSFRIQTPLGWIILNGENSHDIIQGPILFSLDMGGNDIYIQASGSHIDHPINVIIDVSGNDSYLVTKEMKKTSMDKFKNRTMTSLPPDAGAGYFGYSILLDMEGNDTYRSRSFSQGAGFFGVGLLWDIAGNDTYDCYSFCQASSIFGGGLLIDSQGSDSYSGFRNLQGFGGTMGSSLLLDAGKDDDNYKAYLKPLDFPSLVDAKINSSFAQGVSLGKRADIIDGHSWSGGVGILLDAGGDNFFEAGFFAQGFAYWYGLGMLLTSEGNDTYLSDKYSQGSSTHYGIGVLYDKAGNDKYRVSQELGIGVGHDFSYGVFMDLDGNDSYESHNLSLGCGSSNGMGFFWDNAGNDTYKIHAKEFMGCVIDRVGRHSLRNRNKTIGLFIDAGGKNSIDSPLKDFNGKNKKKTWINSPEAVTPEFARPFYLGGGFFIKDSFETFPDKVSIQQSQVF